MSQLSLSRHVTSRILRVSLLALVLAGTGLVAGGLCPPSLAHAEASSGPTPFFVFTHIATSANTGGNVTRLDDGAGTDGHPDRELIVTPNWDPNEVYFYFL